ncbi:EamA-like transporter family protein [compost metagenome]
MGTVCLTVTLPFVLPAALPVLQGLSGFDWFLLISTGLTGGVGHLFQIAAYRRAPASTLAPFIYLQIISATSVGWLVYGHFPDPLTWLGIAIICASGIGIGLIEWRRSLAISAAAARAAVR